MNAPDPIAITRDQRIHEGFAVAALVLGQGDAAPLADGLLEDTPWAAALEAALRRPRSERHAFLRSALRRSAAKTKPALPAASRAAARARALLDHVAGAAQPARRGFVADPQLIAWLGRRGWAAALGTEAR